MTADKGTLSLGLRGRLAIWFAIGAVGVLIVAAIVLYGTGVASIQGTLGQTYCQIASRVTDQFETHFWQKTSLVRNIALDVLTSEAVIESNNDYRDHSPARLKRRIERQELEWEVSNDEKRRREYMHPQLSQRLSILANLEEDVVKSFSVYGIHGTLIGSTATTGKRNVQDAVWFKNATNNEAHFTYLDVHPADKLLIVAVPVWGGANIAGFVYAELDFALFIKDVLSARFGQTGEAIAVDYAGVPLIGDPRAFLISALSEKRPSNIVPVEGVGPGSEPYWVSLPTSNDGGFWERLVCVAPLASLNTLREIFSLPPWSIVVTQSPDESYAALKESLGSLAIAGFFGVILVAFSGGLLAWTMTQPLRDLREGVRQFAGGDRDHPVKVSSSDEIGELAEEFNRMARRVSESENELRAFAQAVADAADAIMLVTPDTAIYYTNPSFERVTGYSVEEALGQNPSILKSGKTPEKTHAELWGTVLAGKPWRGEVWNKRKNGEVYPAELTVSPIHDENGNTISYIGIQRDITLSHAYQEELEKEVEARTKEIADTRSLTVMGRMASMIAHDLRNALSTIKMNLQILNRKHDTVDDPEHEHCQIGLDQVRYMEEFLSDMLSFARPEKLQSDWNDVNQIVEEALSAVSHSIEEHSIVVFHEMEPGLPKAWCDHFKILAVLRNVIDNAINALPDGGSLTISTRLQMQSPDPALWIEISDNGRGIEADILPDVMQPFFTTRTKGTGLGLAIVKGIIDRHGGNINITSKSGQGTQVSFTLPTVKHES